MEAIPDLATIDGVEAYLAETEFACSRVVPLAGGIGNFTYRLFLRNPYEQQTTVILKHAAPYLANRPGVPFAVERQIYEAHILRQVLSSGVCSDLVSVPKVFHHDTTGNFLILEDCGESNLKQFLLANTPTLEAAAQIGKSLGEFLGKFHAWGLGQQQLLEFLGKNAQAKAMTASITYGRLVPMLSTHKIPATELLPEAISDEDLEPIAVIVAERTAEIQSATTALTMGDFWTGNIVIQVDSTSGAVTTKVVDWELAKPGIRALDVGQFCAEVHCVGLFNPEKAEAAAALIKAFLIAYRAHCGELEDHIAGTAAKHMGAHLCTITPTAGWGTPEETVKAVQEGLTYLWEGCSARWLRERSVFEPLT
ncbi:APH domain-containing protein [Mycena chlorophos]|uniref:APH domain-containing protein n=1 Tax=Mycena chlorophos TaxID=658473 RepID=A0A8H6WJH6_MYCCL|nr:APH domain-containing protein [Mycena chlorophos]